MPLRQRMSANSIFHLTYGPPLIISCVFPVDAALLVVQLLLLLLSFSLCFCCSVLVPAGPGGGRGGAERRWAITPTKWRVKMQAEKQRDIKRWERGESGAVGGHGRCSGGVSRHFKGVIWGRVSVKWKANVAGYYLFILISLAADLVSNVMLLQGGPSRGSQARVSRLWLWPERGCWVIISKLLLLACQWWWWWWWWCSFWGRSGCHTHFWGVTCNQLWSFTRSGRPSGDGRSRFPADFEPHDSFILQHAGTRRAKIFWRVKWSWKKKKKLFVDMCVFCRKSLSLAQRRQEAHQD